MKNLFQSLAINKENDCKQFHVSQINANNYTNYFILPENKRKDNNQTFHPSIKIQHHEIKAFSSLKSTENTNKPIKLARKFHNANGKTIEIPLIPIQSQYERNKGLVLDHNDSNDNDNNVTVNNESSTIGNNQLIMFLNYTQDKVIKNNRNKRKYNSFDYRSNAITHQDHSRKAKEKFVDKLLKIYNGDADKKNLVTKVKQSIEKVAEVDEMLQGLCKIYNKTHKGDKVEFDQLGKWVIETAIRQELYTKQIELYHSLCEEIINKANIKKLNEIEAYANDLINEYDNIDSGNSYFFRSINTLVKNKRLALNRKS